MNLYSTSAANTDNFVRNEVYDYTVDLKPDNYVRKTYSVDNPYENEQKLSVQRITVQRAVIMDLLRQEALIMLRIAMY